MKTFSKTMFGSFSQVAPVRNVASDPELIVTSTLGGFRITPQVSIALGLSSGDYIMLLNNHDSLRQMIINKHQDIIDFIKEQNEDADIDSVLANPSFTTDFIKEFGAWCIAKGIKEFNKMGVAEQVPERISLKTRKEYVENNFEEILKNALTSNIEELVEALSIDGITKEEQIEILAKTVEGKLVDKYRGAKCASTNSFTGSNCPLNFSDSTSWNLLKQDTSEEERLNFNRTFAVKTDEPISVELNNGFEMVTVTCFPLGEYKDAAQASRKKTKDTDIDTEEYTEEFTDVED